MGLDLVETAGEERRGGESRVTDPPSVKGYSSRLSWMCSCSSRQKSKLRQIADGGMRWPT